MHPPVPPTQKNNSPVLLHIEAAWAGVIYELSAAFTAMASTIYAHTTAICLGAKPDCLDKNATRII